MSIFSIIMVFTFAIIGVAGMFKKSFFASSLAIIAGVLCYFNGIEEQNYIYVDNCATSYIVDRGFPKFKVSFSSYEEARKFAPDSVILPSSICSPMKIRKDIYQNLQKKLKTH